MKTFYKLCLSFLLLNFTNTILAQDSHDISEPKLFKSNQFKFEFGIGAGGGFNKKIIGKNPNNDKILKTSFNGGIGIRLNVGYCFSPSWEMNLTYIYQSSPLVGQNTDIFTEDNVEGGFNRSIYLLTPKYNLPVSNSAQLKFGLGCGYYGSGEFVYEIKNNILLVLIPIWQTEKEYIFKYNASFGFHTTAEFEYFFTSYFAGCIGMKYYNTNYKLNSIKLDGSTIEISEEIRNYIGEMEGSGMDFIFSVLIYI